MASTDIARAGVSDWVARALGEAPRDPDLYARALTHASHAGPTYERLEFLGDRVLGLVMAEWLYETFPDEPEGALSKRFNTLVTGPVCADVARGIGAPAHLKLGKQARDDGAGDSDNVLGDAMEALLGAFYREHGLDAARDLIRRLWRERIHRDAKAPQHPKSALQEWAAANNRRAPTYEILDRSGPGHAPRFRVRAAIGSFAEAEADGGNKQEAETAAAKALLERVTGAPPGAGRPSTSSGRTEKGAGQPNRSVRAEPVVARPASKGSKCR